MTEPDLHKIFGDVAGCGSLLAVAEFLCRPACSDRRRAAAYGMVLVAAGSARSGTYRVDALDLLNQLSRAKADLDAAVYHAVGVVEVTAEVLLTAQRYVDDATIPCTEWPSTREIADVVLGAAVHALDKNS